MGLIIPYVGLSHSRYINSMDKSETTIVTDVTDETDTTDTTVTFVQHIKPNQILIFLFKSKSNNSILIQGQIKFQSALLFSRIWFI